MKRYKIYLCEYIHPTARKKLEEQAQIVAEPYEADAAVNRNLRMDRSWLLGCKNLKVIGIHGTGVDGVDLSAARELGIRVVNAPGENADSVAELIVAMTLMLCRRLPEFDRMLQRGERCVLGGGDMVGRELRGKVFGMVGCGDIARKAGRILRDGFGMELIGYSPSLTQEKAAALGVGFCRDAAEVFRRGDVVNIGMVLNEQTRNSVGASLLSQAKPGAFLINTARGGIVDEAALYDALASGKLAGAACDVFAEEPPTPENPLLSLPNFIAMPHIGANTEEALYRVSNTTVDQILAALNGEQEYPYHWVN